MDRIENYANKTSSIVACVFVAAVTFLPSRYLATVEEIYLQTQGAPLFRLSQTAT
jgi:hypothetical protein